MIINVPVNKDLLTGTVPVNKELLTGMFNKFRKFKVCKSMRKYAK